MNPDTEDTYARHPQLLHKELIHSRPEWVVLDEVQRVPRLLDVAHSLIESTAIKFILTGSSARKLKRGGGNLLAGRAFVYHLHALTAHELGTGFDLDHALSWGTLPKIHQFMTADEKVTYLRAYGLTYLKEEIQSEQLVRKLEPFRDFLEIAAVMNGKIINYEKIARDIGCDNKTVQSYYQILEDTWLGFYLPAYHVSVRKSQRRHPKFYLFDPGVKRALERSLDVKVKPGTSLFGEAFEHWVILEIFRYNDYYAHDYKLSYYQTFGGHELDLVLSKPGRPPILVEIKSSDTVDEIEVNRVAELKTELKAKKAYFLSRSPQTFEHKGVLCREWRDGIKNLFESQWESE